MMVIRWNRQRICLCTSANIIGSECSFETVFFALSNLIVKHHADHDAFNKLGLFHGSEHVFVLTTVNSAFFVLEHCRSPPYTGFLPHPKTKMKVGICYELR